MVTAEQAGAYKPLPQAFEHLMKVTGRTPERIVHTAQGWDYDILPTRRYHRSLLTRRKTGGQMHEERDGAALRPGSRWLSRRQRGQRWTGRDSRVEIAGGLRLG